MIGRCPIAAFSSVKTATSTGGAGTSSLRLPVVLTRGYHTMLSAARTALGDTTFRELEAGGRLLSWRDAVSLGHATAIACAGDTRGPADVIPTPCGLSRRELEVMRLCITSRTVLRPYSSQSETSLCPPIRVEPTCARRSPSTTSGTRLLFAMIASMDSSIPCAV